MEPSIICWACKLTVQYLLVEICNAYGFSFVTLLNIIILKYACVFLLPTYNYYRFYRRLVDKFVPSYKLLVFTIK